MPIYAYRCTTCGHAKDVLQKMSDAVLTVCPACGAATYAKQLTAAGFQLKGSGWYVTDFRGGKTEAPAKAEGDAAKPADKADGKSAEKAPEKAATDTKPADKAAATPAPAPATTAPPPSSSGS
jgi:putative FmdB family regulatory protein